MGPPEGLVGRASARPPGGHAMMRRLGIAGMIATLGLLAVGPARAADVVPGATGEGRAVNGAKAYLKKLGGEKLGLTMIMVSLFAKAEPKDLDGWEKLTGNRLQTLEYA